MNTEQKQAGRHLSELIKKSRASLGEDRGVFARRIGKTVEFLNGLEHGNIPNSPRILRLIIKKLPLSKQDVNLAHEKLQACLPRQWKNRKFHLNSTILRQRSHRSRC